MEKIKLSIRSKRLLADTVTPVAIYLKMRDRFANSFLLESSDYHGEEDSFSYICCSPMASLKVIDGSVHLSYPDGREEAGEISEDQSAVSYLRKFIDQFDAPAPSAKHIKTGLFGYMAYDAVAHFEDITLTSPRSMDIPEISYHLFHYVIALDHFKNECFVIETYIDEPNEEEFREIVDLVYTRNVPAFQFQKKGDASSNFTDAEFLEKVKAGIHHCDVGDVFQVVFSRRFRVPFQGDEFQVYRTLRSINPSPYLFYFDYGGFKIFGSSPEAQIVVKEREATIYPIAGTFRRTGDDAADAELANKLLEDEKENSEHIMLVDLARNDLSKSSDEVTVETYKEIQYYSHVIHLVSKVTGKLRDDADPLEIVASTFPAGTLSGAPKHRAMQLIDEYEQLGRGFYGGAIGFMDFQGNFNHAIMIRTFLSQANHLILQAGAGIVSKSHPESEVQEVYNKLAALDTAMSEAEKIEER